MPFFWVQYETGPAGSIVSYNDETAKQDAEEIRPGVVSVKRLPYNAEPALRPYDPEHWPLCYTPGQCAGRSSCPKSYSCSE